jgi:hypothetical protein
MGRVELPVVEPDTRDSVVHFVRMIHEKTDIEFNRIIHMIGIHQSKFYSWTSRLGKPNEHNSKQPKAHWLLEEEKQTFLTYAKEHKGEGYRRLTYMMMDRVTLWP